MTVVHLPEIMMEAGDAAGLHHLHKEMTDSVMVITKDLDLQPMITSEKGTVKVYLMIRSEKGIQVAPS